MLDANWKEIRQPMDDKYCRDSTLSFPFFGGTKKLSKWINKNSSISKYVLDILTIYDINFNRNVSRILLLKTWNAKTKKGKRRELKRFSIQLRKKL